VVWVRFLGQLLLIITVVGALRPRSFPTLIKSARPWHQLLRSCLLMGSTVGNFLALRHLRLDQTTSIAFLAPLTVALLAGPFLGEWVGWRRLLAIIVGFGGILIVVRPGLTAVHPAMIYSFLGMLSYAFFILITRWLAAYDPPEVTLFYSLFEGATLAAPLAVSAWSWPADAATWALLFSTGVWGGIGHYLFILAYRSAPASTLAPFIYFQLVSMVGLGYALFGDLPDAWTLAGSGVVILSGIYLVHRERMVREGGGA
jgi:drug/metabolite transporter (DMT)-like permease